MYTTAIPKHRSLLEKNVKYASNTHNREEQAASYTRRVYRPCHTPIHTTIAKSIGHSSIAGHQRGSLATKATYLLVHDVHTEKNHSLQRTFTSRRSSPTPTAADSPVKAINLKLPQQLYVEHRVATTALHRLPRTPRCHRSLSASLPFKSRSGEVHSSQSRNSKGESHCYDNETQEATTSRVDSPWCQRVGRQRWGVGCLPHAIDFPGGGRKTATGNQGWRT